MFGHFGVFFFQNFQGISFGTPHMKNKHKEMRITEVLPSFLMDEEMYLVERAISFFVTTKIFSDLKKAFPGSSSLGTIQSIPNVLHVKSGIATFSSHLSLVQCKYFLTLIVIDLPNDFVFYHGK